MWAPPPTILLNEYIVAAYWWTKNVTAAAKEAFQANISASGTPIAVNTATLGSDPAQGQPKQCTIVYGKFIAGQWFFSTAVGSHDGENLIIPPAVPQ